MSLNENSTSLQSVLEAVNSLVGISAIVDVIYPVGAIYTSTTSTNPAELFGIGVWEQVKDVFLLAAGSSYSAGSTGGEATHTLTVDEMPSHNHTVPGADKMASWPLTTNQGDEWQVQMYHQTALPSSFYPYTCWSSLINEGGSAAHNNMPPYLVVYVWKRIS